MSILQLLFISNEKIVIDRYVNYAFDVILSQLQHSMLCEKRAKAEYSSFINIEFIFGFFGSIRGHPDCIYRAKMEKASQNMVDIDR